MYRAKKRPNHFLFREESKNYASLDNEENDEKK